MRKDIIYTCDDCAVDIPIQEGHCRLGDLVLCGDCFVKECQMKREGTGPYELETWNVIHGTDSPWL